MREREREREIERENERMRERETERESETPASWSLHLLSATHSLSLCQTKDKGFT